MINLESKIRVTKIQDIKFDNDHPNGVNPGDVREGIVKVFGLGTYLFLYCEDGRGFHTSTITAINEKEMTFSTLNSIYKVEILN